MRVMDASIAVIVISAILFATMVGFTTKKEEAACVGIFYDQPLRVKDEKGEQALKSLQKILNHALPFSQVVRSIESYRSGDLDKCHINFYLGSHFDNRLPRDFLSDYVNTRQKIVWLGYNVWQLGEQFEKMWGLRFIRLTTLDKGFLAQGTRSMYFSEVLYKGQVYLKALGEFEQAELLPTDLEKFDALAESRHPGTREVIPFIVRSGNRYYIANIPTDLDKSSVLQDLLAGLL